MISDPAFLRSLSDFLASPVIRLEPSERINELVADNARLRSELDKLNLEYQRMKSMFADEMNHVLHLEDLCRVHGIRWR